MSPLPASGVKHISVLAQQLHSDIFTSSKVLWASKTVASPVHVIHPSKAPNDYQSTSTSFSLDYRHPPPAPTPFPSPSPSLISLIVCLPLYPYRLIAWLASVARLCRAPGAVPALLRRVAWGRKNELLSSPNALGSMISGNRHACSSREGAADASLPATVLTWTHRLCGDLVFILLFCDAFIPSGDALARQKKP